MVGSLQELAVWAQLPTLLRQEMESEAYEPISRSSNETEYFTRAEDWFWWFFYSLKPICGAKSKQNNRQRLFPLQKIYDYSKHFRFDHDRVHIARNINGTGTIKQWNCNLIQAQPGYATISDSNNGRKDLFMNGIQFKYVNGQLMKMVNRNNWIKNIYVKSIKQLQYQVTWL